MSLAALRGDCVLAGEEDAGNSNPRRAVIGSEFDPLVADLVDDAETPR